MRSTCQTIESRQKSLRGLALRKYAQVTGKHQYPRPRNRQITSAKMAHIQLVTEIIVLTRLDRDGANR
jgi:hypothetical protein